MRPAYTVTRVTTQFGRSRHVLYSFIQDRPLDDRLSHHLPLSLLLLCDDSKMPSARPISNRRPGVDQSLSLLLRLDLCPRHRVFDSPPLQLLLINNRKSHIYTVFRLVPTSVTLNDLERRSIPYFAIFHRILDSFAGLLRHSD